MSCQGMPNETGGIHAYAEDIYVHWKVTREIRDGTMVCPQGSLPTTEAIQGNGCLGLKLMMCLGSRNCELYSDQLKG